MDGRIAKLDFLSDHSQSERKHDAILITNNHFVVVPNFGRRCMCPLASGCVFVCVRVYSACVLYSEYVRLYE